jgi:hypothetical protein
MKTIALLDHHTIGHHLAFVKLFAKYLIRGGHRVCIFYPDREDEIRRFLIGEGVDEKYILFEPLHLKKKTVKNAGRFNQPVETLLFWYHTERSIRKAEKKYKVQFSFVFFAWLDDYLCNDLPYQFVDLIFPFKWSGLFFHPNYLHNPVTGDKVSFSSLDSVLMSRRCVSVAIHDEQLIGRLQRRIMKPVILFPEIADTSAPDLSFSLTNELVARANGRTIVGLIGLEKRKGVLSYLDLIQIADPKTYFFFLAGTPSSISYDAKEYERLDSFITSDRENFFFFNGYINEGAQVNSVVCACDVLYLVYDDFKSSSNFMTKGVFFRKLFLSTNRFWIGFVTSEYKTGVCVTEGNSSEALRALNILKNAIDNSAWDYSQYARYNNFHNEKNLAQAFTDCLIIN